VAGLGLVVALPTDGRLSAPEPAMVDLSDAEEPPPQTHAPEPVRKKIAERTQRVLRETAPRGVDAAEKPPPQQTRLPSPSRQSTTQPGPAAPPVRGKQPGPARQDAGRSGSTAGARQLARLEESYQRKYEAEIAEGKTRLLNADGNEFASFLRRFETEVDQVWLYPQAALLRGIEGITPVKITFARGGEIVRVELLESSGSRILDDEVLRSLRRVGPLGSFPAGYAAQTFDLVAFFQYSNGGGRLR
jgi:periplasmic protein TonB